MMLTRDKFGKDKGCICDVQVAWACAAATMDYGYEQWREGKHSRINLFGSEEHECGCEMYSPIFIVEKDESGVCHKTEKLVIAKEKE